MATRRSKIKAALSKSISSLRQEGQRERSATVLKCVEDESVRPEIDENGVNFIPNLKAGESRSSAVETELMQQENVVHQDGKLLEKAETEATPFENGCRVEENIAMPHESLEEKHARKIRPLLRRKIKPKIPISVRNTTSVAAKLTSPSAVEGNDEEVVTQRDMLGQGVKLLDQVETVPEQIENGYLVKENVDVALSASQDSTEGKCGPKVQSALLRRKIKPKIPSNVLNRTSGVAELPVLQQDATDHSKNTELNTSDLALLEKGSVDVDMHDEQNALLQMQSEDQKTKGNAVVVEQAEVQAISKPNGSSFRRRIMKPNLVARTVKLETGTETEPSSPRERQTEIIHKSNTEYFGDSQAEHGTVKSTPKGNASLCVRRRSVTPNIIRKNSKSEDEGTSESPSISSRVPVKPNNKIIVLNNEIIEFARSSKPGNSSEELTSEITLTPVGQFGSASYVSPASNQLLNSTDESRKSDSEYSAPLSPTKLSRPRMRPNPLGVAQRYRHTSASESEEESRKSYRQRNDSICSATSTTQDAASVSDCFSPQKPKEYNSVIQRKCRRSEQSRKLAEAKHDFALKFGSNKPDRKKLTMIDLIFYNPTTNLMGSAAKKEEETDVVENVDDPMEQQRQQEQEEEPEEQCKSGSDEENEMPAPQLKIGPDGQLMIDERSLKVESKSMKKDREKLEKSKVIDDGLEKKGLYKRAKRSKDWNKQETLKFYRALNTIGTDFTLMCELFPRRTRRELKMKFKKEERMNLSLVNRAIMEPCGFDFNLVKHEADMEEKELVEIEKQKQRELEQKKEASKKRKILMSSGSKQQNSNLAKVPKMEPLKPEIERKKSKNLDIMDVLDDEDSDDAADDVLDIDSDGDVAEDKILQSMTKPTRSGRLPKIRDRYVAPPIRNQVMQQPRPQERQPGSLTVMTTTGPDGQPVYKVFMNNSKGLENLFSISAEISSKANDETIESKKSYVADENMTIPADENVTIPAEENVTIPAEENVTIPAEENVTIPADENVMIPADENVTIPEDENVTVV